MSNLNELYLSHIGRVNVGFIVSANNLEPITLTQSIGIQPDSSAKCGDQRKDYKGRALTPHKEGFWEISSKEKVLSKDVNEHFSFLLKLLLPHQQTITNFLRDMEATVNFDVLWESNYLHAGTGPILSKEAVNGASLLNASIGFDIYQIE